MSNKVYVGNVAYNTTEEGLKDFFAQVGTVTDVSLIVDRETGRSRGFAFVSFDSEDGMNAAISQNDQSLDGRQLRVRKAEERQKRF